MKLSEKEKKILQRIKDSRDSLHRLKDIEDKFKETIATGSDEEIRKMEEENKKAFEEWSEAVDRLRDSIKAISGINE